MAVIPRQQQVNTQPVGTPKQIIPKTGGPLQGAPGPGKVRFGMNPDGSLKDFNAGKIQNVGDGQYRYGNKGRVFSGLGGDKAATKLFQDRYDRRAARIPTATPPSATPPAGTNPPAGQQPTPLDQNPGSPINPAAFFPGHETNTPEAFKNDSIYKFNMEQGNKELDRRLAAMGLSGSGASLEAANDLISKVNADAAQRWTDTSHRNADRLYNMSRDESDRLLRKDENAFNEKYKMIDLLLGQNPMQYSMGGLNQYGDLRMGKAKDKKNYLANAYPRQIASGGGGMPPRPPGQPFTGDIDALERIYGNNSSSNWWDTFTKGIGTIANFL